MDCIRLMADAFHHYPHHNKPTKEHDPMAHITIKDRPCGWGKSTEITESYRAGEKYITVVPFLSEADRIAGRAKTQSGFTLLQPNTTGGNKTDHAAEIVRAGGSIVCTHALLYRLGTLATDETDETSTVTCAGFDIDVPLGKSLLHDHHLIIDEVVNPFEVESGTQPRDFARDYVENGMATVDPITGKAEPTIKWDERFREGGKTFRPALYEQAKSGALYVVDSKLFVMTIPMELLLKPKSVTIYTYLSEGTMLLQFLRQLQTQLNDTPQAFTLEVDKLPADQERAWIDDVRSALTVKSIPALEAFSWSYSGQRSTFTGNNAAASCRKAGNALKKFYAANLANMNKGNVLLTCARELWYDSAPKKKPASGPLAEHARLFGHPCRTDDGKSKAGVWGTNGVRWIGNTTRGVNDYITCTHAIYLYDQNPRPELLHFLSMPGNSQSGRDFSDAYALSEMVQWLFRCCIRRGGVNGIAPMETLRQRATVYIPSKRMRYLLINWLNTGKVYSGRSDWTDAAAAAA